MRGINQLIFSLLLAKYVSKTEWLEDPFSFLVGSVSLAKLALVTIPSYVMQIMKLPNNVCVKIYR